ncbi:hypothetical protein MASR2M70_01390 [Bacillota bacterium]
MNFLESRYGYIPTIKFDFTDALHDAYGFGQITKSYHKKQLKALLKATKSH